MEPVKFVSPDTEDTTYVSIRNIAQRTVIECETVSEIEEVRQLYLKSRNKRERKALLGRYRELTKGNPRYMQGIVDDDERHKKLFAGSFPIVLYKPD